MMNAPHLRTATLSLLVGFGTACNGGPEGEAPTPDPGADPVNGAVIDISPQSGPPGTRVSVDARGFEPGRLVNVGFGPPQSEYDVLREVQASSDGGVHVTVAVPDWAEQRDYVFVVDAAGRGGERADPGYRVPASVGEGEIVEVTGRLTDEGVECQAMRSDEGTLYTLTGDLGGYETGDRVTVEGRVPEASFCMQGTTLEVRSIRGAG